MQVCKFCGQAIVFRTIDGVRTPFHQIGPGCDNNSANDFCIPTVCQVCGSRIYYVRHNGGSIFFYALGHPWPRQALPSYDEQRRIADILAAHDTRLRAEENYLDKLKLQKQGLMHDLLTGWVRVAT
jgi:hypothetical protein